MDQTSGEYLLLCSLAEQSHVSKEKAERQRRCYACEVLEGPLLSATQVAQRPTYPRHPLSWLPRTPRCAGSSAWLVARTVAVLCPTWQPDSARSRCCHRQPRVLHGRVCCNSWHADNVNT